MTAQSLAFDPGSPNVARMYDYLLGGKDNFEVDRAAAERIVAITPDDDLRGAIRENRAFLGRAVRYLSSTAGIRQFIDIGTGLPTQGNVHQVAQNWNPAARVIYVDNDPVVLTHGRALLARTPEVRIIRGDLRDPATFLRHREVRELIDFNEPVAVLMIATLHFISDDDEPAKILAQISDAIAPGSYVAISHGTRDEVPDDAAGAAENIYTRASAGLTLRTHAEICSFFDRYEMLEPGVANVAQWRPDRPVNETVPDTVMPKAAASILAGVGRKPHQ